MTPDGDPTGDEPIESKEYLAKMRGAMPSGAAKAKVVCSTSFATCCGYDRKHAIKLLNAKPAASKGKAGRKPVYATEVVAVIKPIWLSSEQLCGKRLKELLPLWLPHYERREGALSKALRRRVLAASAATLDRLLSPYRSAHPKALACPQTRHLDQSPSARAHRQRRHPRARQR